MRIAKSLALALAVSAAMFPAATWAVKYPVGPVEGVPADTGPVEAPAAAKSAGVQPTMVRVSEKLPGMKCGDNVGKPGAPVYVCEVKPGFGGFFDVLRGLLKYGTFIALLVGVLMIVVAGIRYSSVGMLGDGEKEKAKEMIIKVVTGIVTLALVGVILNTIAPWVFK